MSVSSTSTFPFAPAASRVTLPRGDFEHAKGRRWLTFLLSAAYIGLLLTWLAVTVL